MITLSQLTEILGWASLINIGFLTIAWLMLMLTKPLIAAIHCKMFDVPEDELGLFYFKFLANYKLLSFVFFLAPYVALKIMGN